MSNTAGVALESGTHPRLSRRPEAAQKQIFPPGEKRNCLSDFAGF